MPPSCSGPWDSWRRTPLGGIDVNNCEKGPGIWLWWKHMCSEALKHSQVAFGAEGC